MNSLKAKKAREELENKYECPYCGEKTLKLDLTSTRKDGLGNWHYECLNITDCSVWKLVFDKRLGFMGD